MKAVVDQELCIGCELCVQICQDCCQMESDKAVVTGETCPEGAGDTCKEAAESCPVDAIKISE